MFIKIFVVSTLSLHVAGTAEGIFLKYCGVAFLAVLRLGVHWHRWWYTALCASEQCLESQFVLLVYSWMIFLYLWKQLIWQNGTEMKQCILILKSSSFPQPPMRGFILSLWFSKLYFHSSPYCKQLYEVDFCELGMIWTFHCPFTDKCDQDTSLKINAYEKFKDCFTSWGTELR